MASLFALGSVASLILSVSREFASLTTTLITSSLSIHLQLIHSGSKVHESHDLLDRSSDLLTFARPSLRRSHCMELKKNNLNGSYAFALRRLQCLTIVHLATVHARQEQLFGTACDDQEAQPLLPQANSDQSLRFDGAITSFSKTLSI